HQVDRGPDRLYQQRRLHLVERPPKLAHGAAARGRAPGGDVGLAGPDPALLSRSAGLAGARHHRRHPDPARAKEEAVDRIRARLKAIARGVDATVRFFLHVGFAVWVGVPSIRLQARATPPFCPRARERRAAVPSLRRDVHARAQERDAHRRCYAYIEATTTGDTAMFMFKKKLEMPSAAEALPGRSTPIPTP